MLQQWFDDFRDLAALNAQIDAVYWAKISAWATIGSIVVSALALIGLLASLRQTKLALEEARISRHEAKLSSDASLQKAADANVIAENALHVDSRPWLVIENARIEGMIVQPDGDGRMFGAFGKYEIRNIGKTPALKIIHSSDMELSTADSIEQHKKTREGMKGIGPALPPGAVISGKFAIQQHFQSPQSEQQLRLNILVEYEGNKQSGKRSIFWVAYLKHNGSIVETNLLPATIHPEIDEPYYFAVT